MSARFARRSNSTIGSISSQSYPKRVRLLRPSEFRKVYDQGRRHSFSLFTAFVLPCEADAGPKFGFTTPRALGKAVVRNRLRRRLRELVRLSLHQFPSSAWIVVNPRRAAHEVSSQRLREEFDKLITRCNT